ncbi:RodZ domain-containing protein [Agarivorans sp. Alg241-V36]|uniref:RodZ domain-containing protein n=1 Tax=Agarivorans sp. Alg241-V36 TaxID=2305992 RepID=UPI0013D8927E|nr:RodZ domain-containing protein [Agarivorans sp. Alg241-V36]
MTTKAESEQSEPTELSEDIEVVSPGQMLQEARVAAKLSQNQVAERLKLRLQVIKDIEGDSFDSGLSSTFVKGYLRAYARLLNLSEDLVLSSYTHLHDAHEQRTEMQSFSGRIKQETHDSRLMKFTYLVGLGIVVLLVIWWWQEKNQQVDFSQTSPASSESRIISPNSEAEASVVAEPSLENIEVLSAVEAEAAEEPSAQPVELVSEPVAETVNEIETEAKAEPETVAEPVTEAVSSLPVSQAAEPAVINSPEPAAEVNQSASLTALSMSFENECWVEIRDATGKRLVADIKQPGQSLSVTGPSPYSIVLGTNAGVSVSYGQESIDLSSFKRGKVVRMKIPNN